MAHEYHYDSSGRRSGSSREGKGGSTDHYDARGRYEGWSPAGSAGPAGPLRRMTRRAPALARTRSRRQACQLCQATCSVFQCPRPSGSVPLMLRGVGPRVC